MGRETDAVAFFAALAEAPYQLRLLPDAAPAGVPVHDKPRWGEALRPVDEPVRLGQDPDLSFAPAPLASFEPRRGRAARGCRCGFFGLLGPNGPLPLHLTEYARERLRNAGDPTLSRFLDIFHHRFLALFYRAWAQAQPHVNRDRPRRRSLRRLRRRVDRLSRRRRCAIATRCLTVAKLFHVGALVRQVRNAEGLAAILAALLPRAGARSRSSSATG